MRLPTRRPFARPLAAALSLLLLAGCGAPATAPLRMAPMAPKPAAARPAAPEVPVQAAPELVESRPVVTLPTGDAANEVEDEVIIRFKGEPRPVPGATLLRRIGTTNAYVYKLTRGGFSVQSVEDLEDADDVVYVEPNYLCSIAEAGGLLASNDPRFAQAWGVGAIKAPQAWNTTQGEGMVVAVVDTGVSANHPDLAGRVLAGRDVVNKDNDAADDQGHGTHVAGTIAATLNNGIGVAGVAPGAKILPIKVLKQDGTGSHATIAAGLLEAVDRGAKIINVSLGGTYDSATLREAIAEVQAKGAIVVAAAGNEGSRGNPVFYPAAYPGVIAVGAVDANRTRAYFSNWGNYVDVAAPGTSIMSTTHEFLWDKEQQRYVEQPMGYGAYQGTSMASPHVAGAAALLLAKYPTLKASHVERIFQGTGSATTGFSQTTAPRMIDVAAALEAAPNADLTPPDRVTGLATRAGAPGEVELSWTAGTDNVGVTGYVIRRDGVTVGQASALRFTDAGLDLDAKPLYTVAALDAFGNEGATSLAVVGAVGQPSALYNAFKVTKRDTKSMTITWTTQQPMKCRLDWGADAGLGKTVSAGTEATTTHSVTLSGLSRFKKYHFRAASVDAAGATLYSATGNKRTKLWWLF